MLGLECDEMYLVMLVVQFARIVNLVRQGRGHMHAWGREQNAQASHILRGMCPSQEVTGQHRFRKTLSLYGWICL